MCPLSHYGFKGHNLIFYLPAFQETKAKRLKREKKQKKTEVHNGFMEYTMKQYSVMTICKVYITMATCEHKDYQNKVMKYTNKKKEIFVVQIKKKSFL